MRTESEVYRILQWNIISWIAEMETLGFSHFLQEPGDLYRTSWLCQSDGAKEDEIPLEDK